MEKLHQGYSDDEESKQLLVELSLNKTNEKGFELKDGIIRYKDRI